MKNKKVIFLFLLFFSFLFALDAVDSEIDSLHLVSPRITGLGMSGVALGQNCEAVFVNPALLAKTKKINTFISSYRLLEDIIYLNGAFSYPFYNGAIGIGYKSRKTGGIDVSSYSDLDVNGRPNKDRIDTATYVQEAFYLGAGYELINTQNSIINNLDIGLGIKSYTIKIAGTSRLEDSSASGYDLDLGIYSDITETWAVGLNYRNFLDSASGSGSLYWRNGTVQPISTVLSFGNKFSYANNGLIVLFDADFYNNKPYKALLHSGIEVRSYKYVILRAGVEQFPYPSGSSYKVFNAVSAGLTFTPLKDFNIDYAYYPGDSFMLNSLHYVGISFDSFDLFIPATQNVARDEYIFKVMLPNDFFVLESPSVTIDVVLRGEKNIAVNGRDFPVENNSFKKVLTLKEGINQFKFKNKDREINRHVFKILSYPELVKEKKDKDVRRLIFTSWFNAQALEKKITLAELADYIVASTGVRLPERVPAVFNNVDIIYLKGYLGSNEVSAEDRDEITKARLAMILARLEGYDYIFEDISEDQWPARAIDVLSNTGYFSSADFSPLEDTVTQKEAILLLAKTGVINRQIADYFEDFPVCYLDRENRDKTEILQLRMSNAEKFEKAEVNIGGNKKEYKIKAQGNYTLPVTYTITPEKPFDVTVALADKYGNIYYYKYSTAKGARNLMSSAESEGNTEEALFLVKTTPKEVYPGIKCNIELSVPSDTNFERAVLSSEILDNDIVLQKNNDIWQAVINIPAEIKPRTYSLNFKLTTAKGQEYTKSHNLVVLSLKKSLPSAVESTAVGSALKDSDILIKTNKRNLKQGEILDIYIGVLQDFEAVNQVQVVFADNIQITAQKVEKMMWKANKQISKAFNPGSQAVKILIKDNKGGILQKKYVFNVEGQANVVAPVKKPVPVVQKTSSFEVFSKLTKSADGRTLVIRTKAPANTIKGTVSANGKNLTMIKEKNGLWTVKYLVPKALYNKTITIKVFVKDNAGKTTQKDLQVNL